MENKSVKFIVLLAGVALFDFLFWQENAGINYICFAAPLIIAVHSIYPRAKKPVHTLIMSCAIILSGVLMTINKSFINVFALFSSFILLTGFLYQPTIRSVLAALPTGFLNYFKAQITFLRTGVEISPFKSSLPDLWRYFRLSLLPVAVFMLFFVIYKEANPIFNKLCTNIIQHLTDWIADFFENISVPRILFMILGAFLIIGVLFDGAVKRYAGWEARQKNTLSPQWTEDTLRVLRSGSMYSLKDEYTLGSILFGLLNLLILVVNVIDIRWQWFGFEYMPGMDLSQLVHEGTYLLILSIVLAMTIIFYFFRANLNFIHGNRLRWLAYAWIVQNVVMVISVAIRNYHYIHYHGLAYKRIGVLVFLTLTVIGLITLTIKICNKESAYHLFKVNTWAGFVVMIILSLFNWDMIIASNNVNHPYPENIDVRFLLSLSDKTLPLLDQNRDLLDRQVMSGFSRRYGKITYTELLDQRIDRFIKKKEDESWQSWNYSESQAIQYFLNHKNSNQ